MRKLWRNILITDKLKKIILLILFLGLLINSVSGEKLKKLNNFINFIKDSECIKVRFKQNNYTYYGEKRMSYEGVLWFKPELNFRIEYLKPEKEIIITNKNGFTDYTVYDDEMMQGGIDNFIFMSPFNLLVDMDKYFEIFFVGDKKYKLKTKSEDTGDIKKINIQFTRSIQYPEKMEVYFHTGSFVIYTFEYFKNVNFRQEIFSFENAKKFYSKGENE